MNLGHELTLVHMNGATCVVNRVKSYWPLVAVGWAWPGHDSITHYRNCR